MCLTPQLTSRPAWNGSQHTSKICGKSESSVTPQVRLQVNACAVARTLSECPVAVARTRPLLQSQTHTVFLASRPTEASRYGNRNKEGT